MDHSPERQPLQIEIPHLFPTDQASGGGFPFYPPDHSPWAWCDGALNDEELDAIIRIGNLQSLDVGITTGRGQSTEVRDSLVRFLYPGPITNWIFQRLAQTSIQMNNDFFRFDLDGLFQGLQFTRYVAPHGHYTWHTDKGPEVGIRKLSFSLLLSDPNDYEGGDLELLIAENAQTVERKRGRLTFFPSWALHRVTPVTSGTRYSLVGWISGPPFR